MVRRRGHFRASAVRVLTQHEPGCFGPSSLLPRVHHWRVGAAALVLSLALHAALVLGLRARPVAAVPSPVLFPVVLIWEEPRPTPVATPTAPAPVPRVAQVRLRPVSAPPPAPPAVRSTPPALEPKPPVAEPAPASAPVASLAAPVAAPALHEPPPSFAPEAWLRVLAQPAPHYPYGARRRRAEGIAWLRVDLAASGRVLRVAVERSTGHRDLDQAALAAVRSWRFAPPPQEVEASDLWFRVPVEFRLR